MIKQLLAYQEEDLKIFKIKKEMLNSDEWKNYSQAKTFLDEAPQKLDSMEMHAIELKSNFDSLKKKFDELSETLSEFDNVDELVKEGANIAFYQKSTTQLTEKVKFFKTEINKLTNKIKSASSEYQEAKAKVIETQNQFKTLSTTYNEYRDTKKIEIDKIEEKREQIGKDIPDDILSCYKTKRKEGIVPIICSVKDDRCSKCHMQLSIASKAKLMAINKPNAGLNDILVCDHCHRILYKE